MVLPRLNSGTPKSGGGAGRVRDNAVQFCLWRPMFANAFSRENAYTGGCCAKRAQPPAARFSVVKVVLAQR